MDPCDITIIIPTFNRAQSLRRALLSVVTQTRRPREVLVIDDCSSGRYAADVVSIVGEFSRTLPIALLRNPTNRGANYSRNRGIDEAKGTFLAFLDSDDFWLPEKLASQMEEIEKAVQYDARPVLSATGRYRINGEGDIIARQFGGRAFDVDRLRSSNFIGTLSSVIVETSVARQVQGFDESLPACQDWDFFIRLSSYVQFVGVPEMLCVYMDHGGDRISGNSLNRIKAHNHIIEKAGAGRVPRSAIYRNMAEDYQQLGDNKMAARFLARSCAGGVLSARRGRNILEYIFRLYFWMNPPRSLRRKRYNAYSRAMLRAMENPEILAKIRADTVFIKQAVISGSGRIFQ